MDDGSATTWESGSELTASVMSSSSVWSEGSNPTDRSSRRALILQMAKARMKSNKEQPTSPDSKMNLSIREEADQRQQDADQEPNNETGADIDFSGDLD